jgi:hypothetical protein
VVSSLAQEAHRSNSLPFHGPQVNEFKELPGQAFRVAKAGDIPTVLRSILSTMVDR